MEKNTSDILFSVIRSVLTNKPMNNTDRLLITENELFAIMEIAVKHDIGQLVALGLKNNGLLTEQNESQFQQVIYKAVYRNERINYEFGRICNVLNKEKIPFIPLKGSVIRDYYPESWMRMSCDIDILVHEDDLNHAIEALTSMLCYKADKKVSYHDISLFSQSGVHLELHFNIKENMHNVDELLSDVWQYAVQAKPVDGYCYCLTPEFFVFHHIAHMSHHFLHGGCGIKPFIDMYIIRNKFKYNDAQVRSLLIKCDMETFYDNVLYVTSVWFGDNSHNNLSMQIEDYILKGGVYGSLENKVTIAQGKQGGKVRYALSRIFISYDALKNYYPVLKTKKWLFPFMQVRRWCRLIFCGGWQCAIQEMRANQNVSHNQSEKMNEFIREIGL